MGSYEHFANCVLDCKLHCARNAAVRPNNSQKRKAAKIMRMRGCVVGMHIQDLGFGVQGLGSGFTVEVLGFRDLLRMLLDRCSS